MASAEERLLLATARLDPEPGVLARACSPAIDWHRLLDLAARHGLAPLLERHLAPLGFPKVPRPVLARLWALHETRAIHNTARARELAQLVAAFRGEAIECVPYKGPTLAQAAYGDVALREFGDLDLLLRREDILRAARLLEPLGYSPEFELAPAAQRAALRAAPQYHLALRGPLGMVELHWRTDPDFPVEETGSPWWTRVEHRPMFGASMPCLPSAELMLVLCVHGSKHHWGSLGWLVDIAELARREAIDWRWIDARARELRCTRRVQLAYLLARELLDAPLPEARASRALRDLAGRIRSESFAPYEVQSTAVLLARNLALFDTLAQRLRHAAQVVFSPTHADWTRWRLPGALAFLYGPLRLARLAAKYTRASLMKLRPRSRIVATLRTPPPRPHSRG